MRSYRAFPSVMVLAVLVPSAAWAANTYYVAPAPTGSDSNPGTEEAPFATWAKAQTATSAGDTVYFRGGRYVYTDATATCGGSTSATVNAVILSKSGASGNPIKYWAYPGEKPVFDFSGIKDEGKYNCRQAGVRVTGSWLHLKGLEFTGALQLNNLNHESWGVYVYGGSNNVFELLDAHHNMGPGFFIQRGGNNLFLNCDSHENEDTLTSNGDGQSADGFGCHPNQASDTGNVFRGCRAWWNTDDGWDAITASTACTVENSWAWYNGYKPDAISNGQPVSLSSGNGNGFKGGGYGMPPSNMPANPPQHTIRFNVAFFNKASGFYANHSPVSPYFYNNTAYKNGTDFNMLGVASDGSTSTSVGILRNNLAFGGTLTSEMTHGGLIDDKNNSWNSDMMLTVSNADFQSITFAAPASCPEAYAPGGKVCVPPTDTTSFAGMASARQADGSLPVLPFLRLAAGSALIDKGKDIGFSYVGAAPDLGAFEYGATSTPAGNGGAGGGATDSRGGSSDHAGGAVGRTGGARNGAGGSENSAGGGSAHTGGAMVGNGGARNGGTTGSGATAGSGGIAVGGTGGIGGVKPGDSGGTVGNDGAGSQGGPSAGTPASIAPGTAGATSVAGANTGSSGCSCTTAGTTGTAGGRWSLLGIGLWILGRRARLRRRLGTT